MIGPMFTISAHNIGYEAMRAGEEAASQPSPRAVATTLQLARHEDDEIFVEVRSDVGFARDIRIGEAKVSSILMINDHEASRAACQAFIDDRAEQIREALLEAWSQEAGYDDSHLVAGGGGYIVSQSVTPDERARAFVQRPDMHMGPPVHFDRALDYIKGFESALEMSQGRQPTLDQFSDLIEQIKRQLGDAPTEEQELEAIDALEPVLAQVYRAATK